MRLIVLAATLAIAAPAFAQDAAQAPDQGTPAATPNTSTPAPDSSAPTATPAPTDTTTPTPAASAMPATTPVDSASLPACSAKVADRCIEKGGGGHHVMTHNATKHRAKKK